MLTLLLIACAPDETSDVVTLECSEGFGMAADGMCYPLAVEDTGSVWGVVEAACEGEDSYAVSLEAPGEVLEIVGTFSAGFIDACANLMDDRCRQVEAGATSAPVEPAGYNGDAVLLTCEWLETTDGSVRTYVHASLSVSYLD